MLNENNQISLGCQHLLCRQCLLSYLYQETNGKVLCYPQEKEYITECPKANQIIQSLDEGAFMMFHQELEKRIQNDQQQLQNSNQFSLQETSKPEIDQIHQQVEECLICHCRENKNNKLTLQCNHSFCKNCLINKVQLDTNGKMVCYEGEKEFNINCSFKGCKQLITHEDIKNAMSENIELFYLYQSNMFERFQMAEIGINKYT